MLANSLTQSRPTNVREPGEAAVRAVRRVAVVDHEGSPLHQGVRHEAPIPAVERVVPVVAEHEIVPFWDDQRSPVVSRWVISGRRRSVSNHIIALPTEILWGR